MNKGSYARFLVIALVAQATIACVTPRVQGPGRQEVRMAPLMIRSETDPLTGLQGYDAQQLLEVGNELYSRGDYDKAVKVYERLLSSFPDSHFVASTLYNEGLAFEQLAEYGAALNRFQRLIKEYPESKSFKDAHFRACFVLAKLERWVEVADTFWAIRQMGSLSPMDELEARVGQGVGMFMQKDYATAEHEFMMALRFFREHAQKEYLPADYWIGQSRFYLGEIYAREFESKELSEPSAAEEEWAKMMGEQLEEKCRLLLRAQSNFIRTIRVGHSGWASAAGYRIGSLYEGLYDDLMQVPVPPDLDGEARDYYVEELRDRVGVLVKKAIKIYEQSLQMAQRVGAENEWVERTSKSLERMKSLYIDSIREEHDQETVTATAASAT